MARWNAAQRAQARARILTAARAVFERRGFEEATMREIAGASGVAVGFLLTLRPRSKP
jgi:AcrR family transcriptional regulator